MGLKRPQPLGRITVTDLKTKKTWTRTFYENKIKSTKEVIKIIEEVLE